MTAYEVEARLNIEGLRRDLQTARQEFATAFSGLRIQAPTVPRIELDANNGIASLQAELAQVSAFKGPDFARSNQEMQILVRESRRLADIQQRIDRGEFVGDDEITRARQLSAEIRRTEFAQLDFEEQRQGLLGIAAASGAAAAALGFVTAEAQRQTIAFDSATTKLSTLSDDSDALAQDIRGLVGTLDGQTNSIEAAAASYEILSAGFTDTADNLAILEASTIGARGGFSDIKTVADATTSVLSAYGDSAGNASTLVDQFVAVQAKGKITVDQLAQSVGKATAITGPLGVGFDQVGAAIATATARGIQADSAISGTRQAFVNLLKPTADAEKILAKFGITNTEAALKSGGLVGILETLADQGATSQELSKIFSDVDGLAVVSTLAGENLGKFKENIDAIANSAGSAAEAADKVSNSFEGRLTRATNLSTEALISLGEGVQTALTPLLGIAIELIEGFLGLPAPVQQLAGVVVALTAGIAGLTAAVIALNAVNAVANTRLALNTVAKLANSAATFANAAAQTALGVATGKTNILLLAQTANLAALAPVAAAAGAAIAVIGSAAVVASLVRVKDRLAEVNGELERLAAGEQAFGQTGIDTQFQLKAAAEARIEAKKNGVELSKEELKAEDELLTKSNQVLDVLRQQLEEAQAVPEQRAGLFGIGAGAAESQNAARAELIANLERQIAGVEERRDTLEGLANAPIDAAADVSLDAKVDTKKAEDALKKAIATVESNASSQSIQLDLENARVELGALESGASEAENFQIAQDFAQRRIDLAQRTVDELKKVEAGQSGEAQEQVRAKRLQAELELVRATRARVDGQVAEEQRLQQIQEDAEQERIRAAEEAQREQAQLERERIREAEEAERERVRAAEQAEQDRLQAIRAGNEAQAQEIQNNLDRRLLQVQQGLRDETLTTEEAAVEIAKARDKAFGAQLASVDQRIAQARQLGEEEILSAQEVTAQLGQLEGEKIRLTQQRVEAQNQAEAEALQFALDALDERLERSREVANLRSEGLGLQLEGLQRLGSLQGTQAELAETENQLLQETLKTRIAAAEAVGNETLAKRLGNELTQAELEGDRQRAEAKRQAVELQNQQNNLQAQQRTIAAEIAVAEARIALERLRAQDATAEEIANQEKLLGLRNQQLESSRQSQQATERQGQLALQELSAEEQIANQRRERARITDEVSQRERSGESDREGIEASLRDRERAASRQRFQSVAPSLTTEDARRALGLDGGGINAQALLQGSTPQEVGSQMADGLDQLSTGSMKGLELGKVEELLTQIRDRIGDRGVTVGTLQVGNSGNVSDATKALQELVSGEALN